MSRPSDEKQFLNCIFGAIHSNYTMYNAVGKILTALHIETWAKSPVVIRIINY